MEASAGRLLHVRPEFGVRHWFLRRAVRSFNPNSARHVDQMLAHSALPLSTAFALIRVGLAGSRGSVRCTVGLITTGGRWR